MPVLNGKTSDHFRPLRPRVMSPAEYQHYIAQQYERNDKTIIGDEFFAIQPTGISYQPYNLIAPAHNNHRVYKAWRYKENPTVLVVRAQHQHDVFATLDANTLTQIEWPHAGEYKTPLLKTHS
ncbi:MAG: hypothetical protein U0Y68_08170 [Blastocatellia bacterium]